jgi:hypothetical protein
MSFAREISAADAIREIRRRRLIEDGIMHRTTAHMVPHYPHPKQLEFLRLTDREALYGGAAGSGKSDTQLIGAAQYVHVPGYAALLVRKTYKDLAMPGAIMSRALEWWRGRFGIKWSEEDRRFTFPSGATITFGYLESENDKDKYQGAEIQYLGVDEATQFPENRVRYLTSRLRRLAGSEVPIRARFTANPGGIGHDWVYRGFVAEGSKGAFVQAFARDNPSLDLAEYELTLDSLDPITKKQLKEGIWIRDGGGLVYSQFDDGRNYIAPADVPKLTRNICGLDFGVNDQNALTWAGWRDHDPIVYIKRSYRLTGLVDDVAADLLALDKIAKFDKIVGDVGGMGKLFQAELAARKQIAIEAAEKTNKWGFISLFNAAMARGLIKVVNDGSCADLVDEWLSLPKTADGMKEAPGFNNHASDSGLYTWRACNSYNETSRVELPAKGSPEALLQMEAELERLACEEEGEATWH